MFPPLSTSMDSYISNRVGLGISDSSSTGTCIILGHFFMTERLVYLTEIKRLLVGNTRFVVRGLGNIVKPF